MRYMDLFSGIGGFALGNTVTVNFPRMIGEKIKPVDKIKKYSNN